MIIPDTGTQSRSVESAASREGGAWDIQPPPPWRGAPLRPGRPKEIVRQPALSVYPAMDLDWLWLRRPLLSAFDGARPAVGEAVTACFRTYAPLSNWGSRQGAAQRITYSHACPVFPHTNVSMARALLLWRKLTKATTYPVRAPECSTPGAAWEEEVRSPVRDALCINGRNVP